MMVFVIGYALNHEDEEIFPLLEKMIKGARMGQYNNLLRSLAKSMTAKVFKRIKCFVQGNNFFILYTDDLTISYEIMNKRIVIC